ncbi:PhzF family phenazine biosynthesis protein [Egicoccus sp. AB-alg6-2]|uniref:PhzF family phenazine biosynthesis protein n=1 Tax=Egicoccus sp. AB-alg6-2 TaxID=3242692 RepID=UPI00359D2E9D
MPPFRLVDAFTDAAFAGNPAGVVVLDTPQPVGWMRAIAGEVQASETAFLVPDTANADTWKLRWFTPTTEVDLCGHATLAAAHVLWQDGLADLDATLRFTTRVGDLRARTDQGEILLDLPAWPVRPHPAPARLEQALRTGGGRYLGRTAGSAGEDNTGAEQANDVVQLPDETAVRDLRPDLDEVVRLGASGLIVTAPADGEVDFVSRYFAPTLGVPEDPVTGSAHATLGPWWAEQLGRNDLRARQLSRRGGRLRVRVDGDRVHVGGLAVTVITGEVIA